MARLSKAIPLKTIAAIPCFNTEGFISDVVSRASKYVEQVVVIDDGSHDGTAERAKGAGAIVVSHSVNRGYGEAIRSCFEVAKANAADVLAILDGDGQHNPDDISPSAPRASAAIKPRPSAKPPAATKGISMASAVSGIRISEVTSSSPVSLKPALLIWTILAPLALLSSISRDTWGAGMEQMT